MGTVFSLFLRKNFGEKLKNAPYAVFMICKKKQRRPQGDRHIIAHTDTAFEDIAVAMNTKVFDTAIRRNAKWRPFLID